MNHRMTSTTTDPALGAAPASPSDPPDDDPKPFALAVKDLTIAIGGRTIIREASFALESGASLAIVGPNGSGKSVLLKALLGLLPYSGEIAWQPDTRVGYVPQKISADPNLPLTTGELLRAKASVQHLTAEEVKSAVEWAGVTDFLDQRVGALSGGQLQRVLIAFALAGDPDVLLVDEPTSSLDEPSEEHFIDLLNRTRVERGATLVLVSHDLTLVRGAATHVLCLSAGAASFGTAAEMLRSEILEKVYRQPVEFHSHGLEPAP
jgi:zinc transport system ATP-binding protein